MKAIGSQYTVCGQTYPLEDRHEYQMYGGLLQVIYERSAGGVVLTKELTNGSFSGLWWYRKMLPLENTEYTISLGEENTPSVRAGRTYSGLGTDNFYIKSEFSNPTTPFKDRPTSMRIFVAKEHGATTIAAASSGNAGVSVAVYVAKAGMCCLACVPQKTSLGKVGQLMVYGATITFAPGGYSDCFGIVWEVRKRYGYANLTSIYVNPYTVEGDKTVAYELFEQIEGKVPNWITVPIGVGPLLSGIYRRYQKLMAMSLVSRLLHMLGVQTETCSPIVKGFEKEDDRVEACIDMGDTMAGGIADQLTGYEGNGGHAIRLMKKSGDQMTSLTEKETREAWSELSRTKGAFAEPTGTTTMGGVKKTLEQGMMKSTGTVATLVIGRGLRTACYCTPGADEGDPSDGNAEVRPIRVTTRPKGLI